MFGGLFVSPKTRLTNYLVETLDEFFEIDRDSIQSNLLSDTRIVLQNVGLRSLLVDNNKELTGSIEKIEFAWKWGGDETTQFIKQVVLTIDGPHFRLRPTPTNTSCPTRSKQEQGQAAPAKDQEPTGYIQGVVQQVIDHLTLRIVDLELTVETLQGDTLTVCSENVELKTKATESSLAGLSQELSVTSLSLSVQENNLHHSLLDPVSYSATVTRTSGQRFVSGATRGLTVQGNSLDATICLHVNVAQAQVLGRVVELFLDTEPVSGPNLDLDPTATTITLPLPALTIRLPHTTIQTSDSMFCCRMDGSLCDFTGSKGIYLDGGIPFFEMGDGVSWKIDLKSSRVSLNGDAATGSMASLAWDEAEMKKLLTSCQEVVSVTSSTVMSKVEDTVRSEIESLDSSWSVSIPGSLSLAVSGSNREFLEVNLSKPFVKLHPDGSVADLSFDGFNVFPTNTFGELSLKIPSAKVTEGNLSCHDSIQLKGESEQCLLDLAGFVQRLLDTGASSPGSPALSKNEAISLPFGIIVQSIELMASGGSGTSIRVEKFRLSRELAVSIDLVEGNRGASFKAKRVNIRGLNLYESVQCTVGTVENACLPGMFELESPVIDFCCHYRPGNLSIRIPKLEIKPLYFDDAGQRNTTSSSLLLPLVVQVDIGSISSSVTQSFNAQVDFARIRARLEPRGTTTHIELAMPLSVRFVDTKGAFVDMSMDSFQCDLDHCVWSMTSLTGRNMYASMSDSIGPTAIAISRIVGSSEALSIKGGVKLSMESTDNADSFREFVQRVVPGNTNSQSETSAPQLPSLHCDRFEARIEKLSTTLTISDVSFQCNIVKMASVALWDDFEMFCSAENISIPVSDVGDFGEVQIDRVLTCRVPYTFELQSPIQAVKARFSEGAISSTLPNCNIRLLKPKKLYDAVGANQNLVPCPIQITIGSLSVFFEDLSDLSLAVTGVDSLIVPGVGLSISNEGQLSARLSHSTGKWLDARLAGPFLVLKPTLDGWQPDSLSCDILQLGPSSACHIDFRFPCLSMITGTATIRIDDNATACLTNPSDLLPLYTDFEPLMRFYEQDGAPPSRTKVVLPQLSVECIEPRGRVAIMGVQVSSADLNCAKLHCRLEDGGAASVEGVAVAFDPGQISIASIAELRVPGGLFIEKSMQNISVAMGEEIAVQCSSANLVLLRNDSRGGTRDITLPDLARPVHLSLGNIAVRPAVGSNDVTLIDSIEWRFASPGSDEKLSRPSIAFSGTVGTVKNKLLNASAVKMSGFVHEGSPTVISRFTASLGPTSIVAGFSNIDWLGTFGGNSDAKSDPVSMPNAHLAGTTLHLAYNGMLVGAETSVRVEEFDGRPSTTSDDIIDHIKNAVMKKVPSFVTNAKFMGESVTDSTARGIGMAAMSSGLTGATMGSVTGLVAADSVRGAIAVGKQARGAEKNDGYKFGDFTRGAIHAVSRARQSPGGAMETTGVYVKENRERLGAAGGQAVGMTVGLAMLGPVGLVAGAYLGSKAGGKAAGGAANAEKDMSSGQHEESDLLGLHSPTESSSVSSRRATESVDLLGLNDQAAPALPSNEPVVATPPPAFQHESVLSNQQMPVFERNQMHPQSVSVQSAPDFFYSTCGTNTSQANIFSAGPQQPQQFSQNQSMARENNSVYVEGNWQQSQNRFVQSSGNAAGPLSRSEPQFRDQGQTSSIGQRRVQAGNVSPYQATTLSARGATVPHPRNSNPQQSPQQAIPMQSPQYVQRHFGSNQTTRANHHDQVEVQATGYRFGDATRSIINSGKKKRGGRQDEAYKFGDFTRGLFGSGR